MEASQPKGDNSWRSNLAEWINPGVAVWNSKGILHHTVPPTLSYNLLLLCVEFRSSTWVHSEWLPVCPMQVKRGRYCPVELKFLQSFGERLILDDLTIFVP
jgi:hypothetical protein